MNLEAVRRAFVASQRRGQELQAACVEQQILPEPHDPIGASTHSGTRERPPVKSRNRLAHDLARDKLRDGTRIFESHALHAAVPSHVSTAAGRGDRFTIWNAPTPAVASASHW